MMAIVIMIKMKVLVMITSITIFDLHSYEIEVQNDKVLKSYYHFRFYRYFFQLNLSFCSTVLSNTT